MKERPILFSTPMVEAILDDRKTQTRRKIKANRAIMHKPGDKHNCTFVNCPYGKPGDLLWVKETWCDYALTDGSIKSNVYTYKQAVKDPYNYIWKPSLFMPKAAARIWLKITDIGIERVQDISEGDAIKEGIESYLWNGLEYYGNYLEKNIDLYTTYPVLSFKTLWQSINGLDSWDQNPWVWVIKFEVISKEGRP